MVLMIALENLLNQTKGNVEPIVEVVFGHLFFAIYFVFQDDKILFFLLLFSASCFMICSTLGSLCCSSQTFSRDIGRFSSFFYRQHPMLGEILERASGALFNFFFRYSTIKPNRWNLRAHLIKGLDERTHFKAE